MGLDHHAQIVERQERQIENIERTVLARMVRGAKSRGLKRADGDAIEVFLTLRQLLAVEKLDLEIAAGLFRYGLGDVFQALGERAALAPERETPGYLRSLDFLSAGLGRETRSGQSGDAETDDAQGDKCLAHG